MQLDGSTQYNQWPETRRFECVPPWIVIPDGDGPRLESEWAGNRCGSTPPLSAHAAKRTAV